MLTEIETALTRFASECGEECAGCACSIPSGDATRVYWSGRYVTMCGECSDALWPMDEAEAWPDTREEDRA